MLVLLHGAGLGRWIWDRVLPHLDTPALAFDLPGRDGKRNPGQVRLQECINAVAGLLEPQTILVGHSISAEVAMGVATAHQNVAAVILVGGTVPESGQSFLSLVPFPQRILLSVLLRRSPNGVRLPESQVRKTYCNDLDKETTDLVLRTLTPEAPHLYLDRLTWSPTVPCFYVKLLNDKSVAPRQQDEIARRVSASRVMTLATGHLPMLASPEKTAAVLNDLVAGVH